MDWEEANSAYEVVLSGKTTMGEKVEEFEEAFARYVGVPHAVMVNSGSSADLLMAWAPPIRGQVIIPAVTWPTHAWAWEMAGWDVKFCDVDGVNTTSELVEQALTSRTKAISIPHLMGVPVDIGELLRSILHNPDPSKWPYITEDCCEALGAKDATLASVGAHGDASWSFFFSHHMTTMEGGMVTTNDHVTADKYRSLRSHGWTRHKSDDKYTFDGPGFNLRPTEVQAAIGLVQLAKVDDFIRNRTANYNHFARYMADHPSVRLMDVPEHCTPSWFGIPMFVEAKQRDALAAYLEENGVETRPILAGNLRNQRAFTGFYFGPTPGADRVDEEGLFVGLHPTPYRGDVEAVANLIGDFL
jgi:CDP-6-deoxy-D-xylo-4-hexulose-3-dehydrase